MRLLFPRYVELVRAAEAHRNAAAGVRLIGGPLSAAQGRVPGREPNAIHALRKELAITKSLELTVHGRH